MVDKSKLLHLIYETAKARRTVPHSPRTCPGPWGDRGCDHCTPDDELLSCLQRELPKVPGDIRRRFAVRAIHELLRLDCGWPLVHNEHTRPLPGGDVRRARLDDARRSAQTLRDTLARLDRHDVVRIVCAGLGLDVESAKPWQEQVEGAPVSRSTPDILPVKPSELELLCQAIDHALTKAKVAPGRPVDQQHLEQACAVTRAWIDANVDTYYRCSEKDDSPYRRTLDAILTHHSGRNVSISRGAARQASEAAHPGDRR